jgi:ribose transport system ATP-binding protein
LVLKKLDKRFGATHALKAVDLTFEAGEIHAIVGENGAVPVEEPVSIDG